MSRVPGSGLFVCSENALRSPMAEAMVKATFGDRVFVDSIGVRDGELDPMSVAVMAEIGIDISGHQPKWLDDHFDSNFDVIPTLSPEAHHQALDRVRTRPWRSISQRSMIPPSWMVTGTSAWTPIAM